VNKLSVLIALPVLALLTGCESSPEDPSDYSACSFFDDRYIAEGAKCVDADGELVEVADSDANWLGYIDGQGPND
jgi:hypothetical protein